MRVDISSDKDKVGFFKVTPHGSIDTGTSEEFREKVNGILDKATKAVMVDLGSVDYISSAGLGILFQLKKALSKNGADLLFCNLKPQIKRLFEIVKALPKESIFASVEEADRYFYRIMNEEIQKQKAEKSKGQ